MADDEATDGSMIDSTILVMVRSLLAGRKFLIPPIRESKLADRADVGTQVSLSRSVRRVDIAEKRPKMSDPDCGCADDVELIVVSCVILVVARTLFKSNMVSRFICSVATKR
jgi:hypothetical protein